MALKLADIQLVTWNSTVVQSNGVMGASPSYNVPGGPYLIIAVISVSEQVIRLTRCDFVVVSSIVHKPLCILNTFRSRYYEYF